MSTILSPSKVRALALQIAQNTRGGKFTRVSKEFIARIESKTRVIISQEVHSHPSVGCTLK